ncbi:NmrA family NAD(P)-binding protein [Actinoplanes sp. NPDC023936]|uniref:SDR family oxidoreductase n=1 Tax=Actinoplanes sp. NPDC023936 TaxID=3154910 RepID=UPI0033F8EEFF
MASRPIVLVTGATGRVGRLVVDGLLSGGAHVRTLVRSPQASNLPPQAEVAQGDLHEPATVAKAAAGADAAFLLWPGFSAAGAEPVIEALTGQVAHLVHLSAARLQRDEHGPMPGVWSDVESIIERSPGTATFVRSGGFAANTLEWAEQVRAGDVVRMPYPGAGRSLVHERDLADVAVRALLDRRHAGRAYVATGPESLSCQDQVRVIGEVLGRRLRAQAQPLEQAREQWSGLMGATFAEQSLAYWAGLVDEPERVTTDVEAVTGHPARSYETWVRDHAGEFRG